MLFVANTVLSNEAIVCNFLIQIIFRQLSILEIFSHWNSFWDVNKGQDLDSGTFLHFFALKGLQFLFIHLLSVIRTRVLIKSASGLIECHRINIDVWHAIWHFNSRFRVYSNSTVFEVERAKLTWHLLDLWHFSDFLDSPTCSSKWVRCHFGIIFQIIHELFNAAGKEKRKMSNWICCLNKCKILLTKD